MATFDVLSVVLIGVTTDVDVTSFTASTASLSLGMRSSEVSFASTVSLVATVSSRPVPRFSSLLDMTLPLQGRRVVQVTARAMVIGTRRASPADDTRMAPNSGNK